jgi:hypothetical protein
MREFYTFNSYGITICPQLGACPLHGICTLERPAPFLVPFTVQQYDEPVFSLYYSINYILMPFPERIRISYTSF